MSINPTNTYNPKGRPLGRIREGIAARFRDLSAPSELGFGSGGDFHAADHGESDFGAEAGPPADDRLTGIANALTRGKAPASSNRLSALSAALARQKKPSS